MNDNNNNNINFFSCHSNKSLFTKETLGRDKRGSLL